MIHCDTHCYMVGNYVDEEENAGNQHLLLFTTMFLRAICLKIDKILVVL